MLKNPSAKVPVLWHFIFPITESFEKVLKSSAYSAPLLINCLIYSKKKKRGGNHRFQKTPTGPFLRNGSLFCIF